MIDRRNVLKLGAAAFTGALVGSAAVRAAVTTGASPVCRGIFDERFEDSLAFSRELNSAGVATIGIRGDLARLWYEDLRVRLRRRAGPIAGLTDRVALFCLEELARDVGMRVSMRIDHLIDESGFVQHDALGPDRLLAATKRLGPRPGFGRSMAVLATAHAAHGTRAMAAPKRTGPSSPVGKTALVTWVIA